MVESLGLEVQGREEKHRQECGWTEGVEEAHVFLRLTGGEVKARDQ